VAHSEKTKVKQTVRAEQIFLCVRVRGASGEKNAKRIRRRTEIKFSESKF